MALPRFFAIVPAAGHSTRMGTPKLLLPLAGVPLMRRVLEAWQSSQVDHVIAVVRPGDEVLAEVARSSGVEVVVPRLPPPDMRASIQAALQHITTRFSPTPDAAFLFAPADMPRLSSEIADLLMHAHASDPQRILVPTIAGRRGHPVLFPWPLAAEVDALAEHEGLDTLVRRYQPLPVPCDRLADAPDSPFADMDTPEDYQRLA